MNELIRRCIQLLVSNRPMNSILTLLLDYVIQRTENKCGFIGERKLARDNSVFYRYHAVSAANGTWTSFNEYMTKYTNQGYFDLDTEHEMHKDISIGDIHINNSPKITKVGHPPIEKTIFLPLHDTNGVVIGILGLSGPTDFTPEIAEGYTEYVDMCSYILQLSVERNNINCHKNRFLANIGNALREPIDGMLNVRRIAHNDHLTASQKQYIDIVAFYSMKLLDMVNDIQDYTRMVSGTLSLVNKTMDLKKCLDAVYLISQQKTTQNVGLTFERAEDLPSIIVADEVRITQILVNLLDNACKFTTNGNVKLKITCRQTCGTRAESHELCFEVSDTGIGMTAEQVYNIFGGTYVATSDEKHVGIGLGLMIVKYLIEMFGGEVSMKSTPNIGTTVKFNLFVGHKHVLSSDEIKKKFNGTYALLYGKVPVSGLIEGLSLYGIKCIASDNPKEALKFLTHPSFADKFSMVFTDKDGRDGNGKDGTGALSLPSNSINIVQVDDGVSVADNDNNFIMSLPVNKQNVADLLTAMITDAKRPVANGGTTFTGRILIAEDDKDSTRILIDLLKRMGYTDIDTVTDGLELYVKLTTQTPQTAYQIVFVSLTIDILDGITAIKRYKQLVQPQPQPVIIAMTTQQLSSQDVKDQCYAAGMNAYLIKPITASDINHWGTAGSSRRQSLFQKAK
jgi:signal transduction histidine kinase